MKRVSIVVPAYNEEGNIDPLVREFEEVRPSLAQLGEVEVVFIDDASTDGTVGEIVKARKSYPGLGIRLVRMKRNTRLTGALKAGLASARGEFIVTFDADLQADARDIPRLLAPLASGEADVAVGIRVKRNDDVIRLLSSKIANGIRNRLTGEVIRDTGCPIKAYRKSFSDRIKLFGGLHRFVPTLLRMEGARVTQMEVNHRPRTRGVAKFNLTNRLVGPFFDLLAVRWMQKRNLSTPWEEQNGN